MSVNACADIVRRGDPDRFLAAMAAPPDARAVLFPLYACNIEIARAPWVTSDPTLAQIRLQWWRDALDEIREGKPARRHEVVTTLADVLDAEGCGDVTGIADARLWDVGGAPFLSEAQFRAHLDATAVALVWTAARLLGAEDREAVRRTAFAEGLARWFQAVPALRARGLSPLPDEDPAAIAAMARAALDRLPAGRLSRPGRIATLSAWEAPTILRQVAKEPDRVTDGRVGRSGFARRAALLWRSARA